MLRWVRLFVVVMIAAALPLRGVAAVLMLGCGPGHHAAMAAGAAGTFAGHGGHALKGMVGFAATAAELAAVGAHTDGHTDHGHDGDPGSPLGGDFDRDPDGASPPSLKCSGCAPCCAAAAPASELPAIASAGLFDLARPSAASPFSGIVLAVPHGPPRHALT